MITPAIRILYKSENYLVVNKVPGEAVEGARPGMINLPLLLDELFPEEPPVTAVNRLDVPVSGCALFARNGEALAAANAQFRNSAVEKHYLAIVEIPPEAANTDSGANNGITTHNGAILPASGELVHWLWEDAKHNKSTAYAEEGQGRKKAILRYRILGRGERYLFLAIELVTGRRHQIRAQLAALGLHIKGDLKYGAKRSEPNGGIRLHAWSLAFQDPADNSVTVTAPPPLIDRLWSACMDSASR
jgi:23S rRNA pseudouridine1911/1915/1917 synthase